MPLQRLRMSCEPRPSAAALLHLGCPGARAYLATLNGARHLFIVDTERQAQPGDIVLTRAIDGSYTPAPYEPDVSHIGLVMSRTELLR